MDGRRVSSELRTDGEFSFVNMWNLHSCCIAVAAMERGFVSLINSLTLAGDKEPERQRGLHSVLKGRMVAVRKIAGGSAAFYTTISRSKPSSHRRQDAEVFAARLCMAPPQNSLLTTRPCCRGAA